MNALSRRVSAVVAIMAALLSVQATFAQDAIIRVDIANGSTNPPGVGGAWEGDAYKFLQDALDRANILHASDPELEIHIWVAAGWDDVNEAWIPYRPDQSDTQPSGSCWDYVDDEPCAACCDRQASFVILPNIEIYGGFPPDPHTCHSGNGAAFVDRDPETHITVLSGDLLNDDEIEVLRDPHTDTFIGLQFENNDENSFHVVVFDGGGQTEGVLDGVTVSGGNANGGGCGEDAGGGVRIGSCPGSARAIIRHCVIEQNSASMFGGDSEGAGGGLYAGDHPAGWGPRVERVVFRHNNAVKGGAVAGALLTTPVFITSEFYENTGGDGGAVFVVGINHTIASFKLINCILRDNIGDSGGAVHSRGELRAHGCLFSGNSSQAGGGGAVRALGPIVGSVDGYVELINCTLVGNSAVAEGGGVSAESNLAVGPILVRLNNSIAWSNEPDQLSQIGVDATIGSNWSNIENGWPGEGNLNIDPQFGQGYTLASGSPMIDQGVTEVLPCDDYMIEPSTPGVPDANCTTGQLTPIDLAGNPRVVANNDCAVDIGAFEFQSTGACPADLNDDMTVNVLDLIALLTSWGACLDCGADLNADDLVNVDDLLILLGSWGACPGAENCIAEEMPQTITECYDRYQVHGDPERLEACIFWVENQEEFLEE